MTSIRPFLLSPSKKEKKERNLSGLKGRTTEKEDEENGAKRIIGAPGIGPSRAVPPVIITTALRHRIVVVAIGKINNKPKGKKR